jgi:hypothetical protein
VSSEVFTKAASTISQWLGVTSTLVATATAIFTTQLAVSVNESNARDRFFEKQLQACTDLGDASIPLQRGLTELDAGFYVLGLGGHKDLADTTLDRGAKMVDTAYDDYRKITDRLFVLYPDSYIPLQAQIVKFTPTNMKILAENDPNPEAAFKKLRDGFTAADLKLRQTCTADLRRYAKTYLMDRAK